MLGFVPQPSPHYNEGCQLLAYFLFPDLEAITESAE